ncbi:MAG TPA: hypothetical protein VFR58_04660 [Flavisolibacter sp.]|nr:hypothetical protein [Flavisolibacter sp.]
MNLTATSVKHLLKRKLATAVLVTASLAAFATLGDGGKKSTKPAPVGQKLTSKNFSRRTNYPVGGSLLTSNNSSRLITMKTVVTFKKGNATYIIPMKKKVLLDKIKFSPSAPVRF